MADGGVEAAGHRVLDQPAVRVGEERAQFERDLAAGRVRPDDADVDMLGMVPRRLDRQHCLG